MNRLIVLWPLLVASSSLAVAIDETADDSFVDHLTFSGRFGLNIGAKFGPRVTSSGGLYNYINGYVLPDSHFGPPLYGADPNNIFAHITEYWGYDAKSLQNYPATQQIGFIGSAPGTDISSHSFDDDPRLGAELSYDREWGSLGKWRYGFEAALNYMNLCLHDNGGYSGPASQYLYSYNFSPLIVNNNPPPQFSGDSWSGVYQIGSAPNQFFISADPSGAPTPVTIKLTGQYQFDADIWGFRVGPYLNHPLGTNAEINFIGGLAVGLIDARASWAEQLTVNGGTPSSSSGSGSGLDVLWGYYIGANVSWHLSQRWDLNGGVQYQDIGTYRDVIGTRQVEMDLSKSIFMTLGLTYKF